ncbi:MAG: hypothetical protein ABSC17_04680 [Thermacetogeniaceae bacterium]
MAKRQKFLFWAVATMAAAVTISGITYTCLSVLGTLQINIFGRPVPAWLIGMVTVYWGGRMLYKLYRLPWRQGVVRAG